MISPRTLTSILKKGRSQYELKASEFRGNAKNKKIVPQRKFKVSKVTWGPVPTKEKKSLSKKLKLKDDIKAEIHSERKGLANKENSSKEENPIATEVEVPKKRGRKPKVKVENMATSVVVGEGTENEDIVKEKPKRGRKPKIKPPVQVQDKDSESKTE